jgi:hypothetical protein
MFFRIMKLFGIDIPARIAEVRIDLEERVALANDPEGSAIPPWDFHGLIEETR